jgi:ATP phosphoribosyltransferase
MLRVAVPNKGSLSEAAVAMFTEAGYRQRRDSKELVFVDPAAGVEFYYLRPRDIAVYVGEGTLDAGVTGQDLLLDSGANADSILDLDFARSTFRFAAAGNSAPRSLNDLQGARIATSYPHVLSTFLSRHGLTAHLVRLDGAVESAIRLGVADVIADVVETGSALRQNGLEVFGPVILDSHAVLIRRKGIATTDALDLMLRRLRGVLVAHNYVMVDYDVPADAVAEASRLTPGLESPTVSPLAREGWFAVRAMVPRADSQQLMDELWDCGARAILLTDIHACRI